MSLVFPFLINSIQFVCFASLFIAFIPSKWYLEPEKGDSHVQASSQISHKLVKLVREAKEKKPLFPFNQTQTSTSTKNHVDEWNKFIIDLTP